MYGVQGRAGVVSNIESEVFFPLVFSFSAFVTPSQIIFIS